MPAAGEDFGNEISGRRKGKSGRSSDQLEIRCTGGRVWGVFYFRAKEANGALNVKLWER